MKKKLQLKKEIVSVLDKKQLNHLTKGGESGDVCPKNCSIVATMACPSQHNQCLSDVCIEPQTKVGCGGESGLCIATDVCPVETATNCETLNIDCMIPADTVEDCVEKQTFACE